MILNVPEEFVNTQNTRAKSTNYSNRKNMDYELLEWIHLRNNPYAKPPTHYYYHDLIEGWQHIEYKHVSGKYLNLTLTQVNRYKQAVTQDLLTHFRLWQIKENNDNILKPNQKVEVEVIDTIPASIVLDNLKKSQYNEGYYYVVLDNNDIE